MKVFDNLENEVIHFHRPLLGCCSFLQSIEVSSPPGQVIGRVKQDCSFCYPQFSVKDHNGDVILRIEGPCGLCSCTGEMKFKAGFSLHFFLYIFFFPFFSFHFFLFIYLNEFVHPFFSLFIYFNSKKKWFFSSIFYFFNSSDFDFIFQILQIFSLDGEEIGKITKHWSGLAQEMFTVADNFSIKFPGDLSIQAKALLLGACILIVRN